MKFTKVLLFTLVLGLMVFLAACVPPQTQIREGESLQQISEPIQQDQEAPQSDPVVQNEDVQAADAQDTTSDSPTISSAVQLAGSTSPYYEFDQATYDQAIADNKKIFVHFYANWCPSCKKEQQLTQDYFNNLDDPEIVGFRVNWRDSDTSNEEKDLASEFGASTQGTKIFVVDGERVHKTPRHYRSSTDYETNFGVYFG